ncbi:L7Ae/L30e/S12e/Gadd45 family ribosomal protein [Thomasclavelia cocleata]|jgi:ribosomal protein L7Ae-like RNA K-turn-binding protein|uniref:Putative ribosomal protein YlxQ n=1 Tax=Thomasclavelia cocleata TaxID=69824 RepID=A0A1I0BR19_9FIRM|nr:ribosomal L7Ae/L30e/S12e/Gadd45 family protein [Thomasclavelia cocleata]MCI9130406.1 50S ribosomal protein L7ae [Thomasclavelia cocleata]MCI9629303.1 50S ribosomal protein L7ae [Thomasclavelia cocleata]MCR1960158.1 ribosomal L7Ae/L30e/S12e/Gadd45 family protein [Thomasclavelia cocleata]NDO41867.1 50S ribosomal protein L7ae [Thomasclavelia cocleata]PJN79941.1 50S ribosomal protein L7ae [Thomasclavelia cocleata]
MSNFLNTLGLASRARKIVTGETLINKIRSNEVHFVIIATDASDNTKKKLTDKCTSYNVDYIITSNIDELSKAVGKNNRVALGIQDAGFAKNLKEKIGG